MDTNDRETPEDVADLKTMLECPACNAIFSDPRILPCQHSVCKECVSKIKIKLKKQVKCPTCEKISGLGEVKRDINKEQLIAVCNSKPEAETASDDSGTEEDYVLAMGNILNTSLPNIPEEQVAVSCDICQGAVTWYCAACAQWLCADCRARHAKVNTTKNHKCDSVQELAKQQRTIIEKQFAVIVTAVERLQKMFSQIDHEIDLTHTHGRTALKESSNLREDWIDKVALHFDSIDVRISDFVTTRVEELQRLRHRVEASHGALQSKLSSLTAFMAQPAVTVVSGSKKLVKQNTLFLSETHVPRVEFTHTNIHVVRGERWDHRTAASLELQGANNVYSVPLGARGADIRIKGDRKKKWQAAPQLPASASPSATPRKSRASKTSKTPTAALQTPGAGSVSKGRISQNTPVPKHMTHAECFKLLTKGAFRLHATATLKSKPASITLIQGNLWCAQGHEITQWTTDLSPVSFVELDALRVKHDLLKEVQALAEMKCGKIMVAAGSGLHFLTKAGRYVGRITDGVYTDVVFANDLLYAVKFGDTSRAKVQVYDETKQWDVQDVIPLPCDGFCTIHVQLTKMYVASGTHGIVYLINHRGDTLRKCGLKRVRGDEGQFNEPHICHGDLFGSVMIADRQNECLQVWGQYEDWEMVKLEQKVKRPACAVYVKRQLFIVQAEAPFRLLKYV